MLDRRDFLKTSATLLTRSAVASLAFSQPSESRLTLPPWQSGFLEIHHIDTGRGNSTLILEPDGTSLLIDAGESHSPVATLSPGRPDTTRNAGEWIARYAARQLARSSSDHLDLLLLTHLHGDHVGEVAVSSPPSTHGNYCLTGAACVAESIRIHEVIDRGWPDYTYPARITDPSSRNYIELAKVMAARGTTIQRAHAGSLSQLALRRNPAAYPDFNARILSVNGDVWTGTAEQSSSSFFRVATLPPTLLPTENMCCVSLVLEFGKFRYFAGGDLTSDTDYGLHPWRDIETPVARAAGPVSVAVVNHHGYFDAGGPAAVRALQPRVWIIPCWHLTHPGMNVTANLLSRDLYPGDRTIFAVGTAPEVILAQDRFTKSFASTDGHVVVRVPPGGRDFTVHVIDSHNESSAIKASFGPFPS